MISPLVLQGLLRSLAVLARTAGFREGETLSQVLGLAAFAVERGEAGRHALEKLCADIDAMAAQGRAPTPEEWHGLRGRSDTAHAQIQAAGEAMSGGTDAAPGVVENDTEGGSTD